ncbi:PaaI family thioesterase [Marivita sp. GX14005]|uniref:PaaI family thioesterase n=1 Tax=Marivita sp. GX14005 TaxID=2942276 RepID=UPI002018E00B|nr:PaaI family thioesterase [Marivita sp. GX14005]MCL3880834.1 PaaI family thioesterase [Marivita sp. GX14005]
MSVDPRIQSSFDRQSMMRTLGAQLTAAENGRAAITAPILPETLQQQGFGHAGLTFSIGDSAAGYAALSILRADQEVLTAEMKINLLAPAKGDLLIARGRVIKPGRRLIVTAADVFARSDGAETHIATLIGTMIPTEI